MAIGRVLQEEIQEAVHYAKTSLGWSAYLNGIQQDHQQFAEELTQIGERDFNFVEEARHQEGVAKFYFEYFQSIERGNPSTSEG